MKHGSLIKDIRIKTKLIICFLAIMLITGVTIVIVTYNLAAKIILEKTVTQSLETTGQISQNIEFNLQSISEKLSYLAYNPYVQEQLNKNLINMSERELNEAKRKMSKCMVQTYSSVLLRDIEVYGNDGQKYSISVDNVIDWNNKPLYLDAARAANGRNVIINDSKEDYVQIVKEINDLTTMQSIGTLRASFKKSVIRSLIRQIDFASDGEILVLDDKNNLVVGNENYFEGNSDKLFTKQGGKFEYDINGEQCVVMYQTSSYNGWKTIGLFSTKVLKKEIRPLQVSAIIVMILVMVLCFYLAQILTNFIVNPISHMVKAFHSFSGGDFSVRLDDDGRKDEIGQMSRGFNKMIVKIDSLIDAVYREELLKKESEFKALQAQINPHFLYNTMDVINWMAKKEGMDQICDMVNAISNLMRASISNKNSFISVNQELSYIEDYLYIQKTRYRDRIETMINVDPKLFSQMIPKLTLQPIVENSIVHGVENSKKKAYISLTGKVEEGEIIFTVEDTGVGLSQQKIQQIMQNEANDMPGHSSLGIYTVYQRLQYVYGAYGPQFGLSMESEEGSWTRVNIRIPYFEDPNVIYKKYQYIQKNKGDL